MEQILLNTTMKVTAIAAHRASIRMISTEQQAVQIVQKAKSLVKVLTSAQIVLRGTIVLQAVKLLALLVVTLTITNPARTVKQGIAVQERQIDKSDPRALINQANFLPIAQPAHRAITNQIPLKRLA